MKDCNNTEKNAACIIVVIYRISVLTFLFKIMLLYFSIIIIIITNLGYQDLLLWYDMVIIGQSSGK